MTRSPRHSSLPPEKLWRKDLLKDGPIPTPYDNLGRVDMDGLIRLGQETIIPESYDWSSQHSGYKDDVHHLQWYRRLYQSPARNKFRELNSRKVKLPRIFHNWCHEITEVPKIPSAEVMRESVIAERVAIDLTRTALRAMSLSQDPTGKDDQVRNLLDTYNKYSEEAANVPPEFQLVTPDQIEADSVDQMLERSVLLGQLALDTIPNRVQEITGRGVI